MTGCSGASGVLFWHFLKKIIKIPTPEKRIILSKLAETNGLLLIYSLKLTDQMHDVRSKSPPWGYASRSNSRGLPDPPPPLGLDIDRCISKRFIQWLIDFSSCKYSRSSHRIYYGHFAPWLDRPNKSVGSNQKLEHFTQAELTTSAKWVWLGSGWKNKE